MTQLGIFEQIVRETTTARELSERLRGSPLVNISTPQEWGAVMHEMSKRTDREYAEATRRFAMSSVRYTA